MKNLFRGTLLMMFISLASVSQASNPASAAAPLNAAEAQRLADRLEQIKSMDMSTLSRKEKRDLRREVRGIQKTTKTSSNGGVYLSVGAIIIIILLLILIL